MKLVYVFINYAGGPDKIRPLWRHYYQGVEGFIFVIDSNDRDRISEASEEMHKTMREPDFKTRLLLVFANKQDLPNAMSVEEVTDKLQLEGFKRNGWSIHVQASCATSGNGLYEGFLWLHNELKKIVEYKP